VVRWSASATPAHWRQFLDAILEFEPSTGPIGQAERQHQIENPFVDSEWDRVGFFLQAVWLILGRFHRSVFMTAGANSGAGVPTAFGGIGMMAGTASRH
jgi:hypothetical protein